MGQLIDWRELHVTCNECERSSRAVHAINHTFTFATRRNEREYFALDITSVSSYSELINDVNWGYNRDKEKLPQVNICMLLGEKSKLPVYQIVYNGSLKDVTTLKTTLETASHLNLKNISVVMDKGFCSQCRQVKEMKNKTDKINKRRRIEMLKKYIWVADVREKAIYIKTEGKGAEKS